MNKNMMGSLGCILAGMMVLSGCAAVTKMNQTQTLEVTPTPTPTPTAIPTSVVTPTLDATATAEVVVEEKPNIYMDEKIEYGGRQFDFQISMLQSDMITKEVFDKYDIKSLAINENKTDAREILAKTIIYTFLDTYNFQNKSNVSLQEYMLNPEKYPAMIVMRGEDGKRVEQAITLDRINSFEMRFTYIWDENLYMGMTQQTSIGSGYSFDGERFIFYSGIPPSLGTTDSAISFGLDKKTELPYFVGYDLGECILRNDLGLMPYTIFRLIDYKGWKELKSILGGRSIYSRYDEITGVNSFEDGRILFEYPEWAKSHQSFTANLK